MRQPQLGRPACSRPGAVLRWTPTYRPAEASHHCRRGLDRRTNRAGLHVRGCKEEGTTTTPFDMAMLNGIDRFQLAIDVIDRVPGLAAKHSLLRQSLQDSRMRARDHTREFG